MSKHANEMKGKTSSNRAASFDSTGTGMYSRISKLEDDRVLSNQAKVKRKKV